jgi:DNA-binding IscR family transcriptional regulator
MAERFEIPLELLAKILQQLARHGLIVAHKGVHGGSEHGSSRFYER